MVGHRRMHRGHGRVQQWPALPSMGEQHHQSELARIRIGICQGRLTPRRSTEFHFDHSVSCTYTS